MRRLVVVMLLAGATGAASTVAAQRSPIARADRLLRAGRVFAAETLYYYAVRRAPRDPDARLALGRYLAARGAWRVGAVLMEEARFFGGDARQVASHLAPVYDRLGDFRALASLPASPLGYAERARADWLRAHPPAVEGPDSVDVGYAHGGAAGALGRVVIRIGGDSVVATIDTRATGLVLDTVWAHRAEVKRFASQYDNDYGNFAGVTLEARLASMTMTNIHTRFAPQRGARDAVVGLDLLAALAPTFDPARGRLTLRKDGRIADDLAGEHIPTLSYVSTMWLVRNNKLLAIAGPDAQRHLLNRRWTLNPRRGEIVVE